MPVHSPWLPGYIDVAQTIRAILTMAGLFPDRHTHTHVSPYADFPATGNSVPMKAFRL